MGKAKASQANQANQADSERNTDELRARLRKAGLRPTKQRLFLARLLFSKGDRHICAETLHAEALAANESVSLATVYNCLHQFNEAGLLRALAVDSGKTYFDTNISEHHHFFVEDENRVIDLPADKINVSHIPEPPEGMEISRIDVIVRLKSANQPLGK